jgi:Spy/CpxP family protein refolding chaperone
LHNQLSLLQIELRDYVSGYNVDVNKIKEYRNQIRDLKDQISDSRLNDRIEINKVLTKEQLDYFNQGGYVWWDTDKGWCHIDRGMKYRLQ